MASTDTNTNTESWIDCNHQLQLSDDEADASTNDLSLFVPAQQSKTKGSVVNMLSGTPEGNQSSIKISVSRADWVECDDHLRLSDEDTPDDPSEEGLYVPLNNLKHKGSVVDMLMSGPVQRTQPKVAQSISVSPAERDDHDAGHSEEQSPDDRVSRDDRRSNYSMTANVGSSYNVRFNVPLREDSRYRLGAESAFKATMTDRVLDDLSDRDRVNVTLRSDAFTYDQEHDTFTISLSNVEIVRQNDILGKLTIKVNANQINRETSSRPEDEMDDQYVGNALDEILQDY